MATHILSLTHAPKIPLVKSGECTQTIRLRNPDRPKKVGDKLILHTWARKPYRSKWDWRLETEISELHSLSFASDETKLPFFDGKAVTFDELSLVATADGIVDGSVFGLVLALKELNGLRDLTPFVWDIIRWPKPTIRRVE